MKNKKNLNKVLLGTYFAVLLFCSGDSVANAVSSEPILWLDFNNQSEVTAGLVKDRQGNYNAQNVKATWMSDGHEGGGISFSNYSSYGLKIGNMPELSEFTETFRMKADGTSDAVASTIIFYNNNTHTAYINGEMGAAVSGGGLSKSVGVDQGWHHYAVSYSYGGKNITLYADGQVKGYAVAANIGRTSAGEWLLGYISDSGTTNNVAVDDLKIYDRVLSAAEVAYESVNGKLCTADTWSCGEYTACSTSGTQTRSCNKTVACPLVSTPAPQTSQSCTPPIPACTPDSWKCADWNTCSPNGNQTRSCNKIIACEGGTSAPSLSQSCTYIPPQPKQVTPVVPPPVYQPPQPSCTADTWSCGDWNACSLSGIQNRSCRKTFDCPSIESAPPAVDQYCESPTRPRQQAPQVPQSSDEISNQDSIVRATVKLICPVDSNRASQGSGTLINSNGTILTNKHVVDGTLGCLVGFVDNFSDEPYFGERQIADIVKMSSSEDVAVLKIRNPQNTSLPFINIANGNSRNLRLGTKIITYGYPSKFGTNITYTSGDFSGTNGNYLKTTAIIEHGNSGGGAYLKDGTFIGVPSAVIKGELNALGYVLSINTINAWLGNSSVISDNRPNNSYSRVSSVLETLDLKKLDSLQLVIPSTVETKKKPAPQVTASPKISKPATPKPTEQTQKNISNSIPNKSTEQKVIENKKPEQSAITEKQEKQPKASLPKRFLFWLAHFF